MPPTRPLRNEELGIRNDGHPPISNFEFRIFRGHLSLRPLFSFSPFLVYIGTTHRVTTWKRSNVLTCSDFDSDWQSVG